VGNGGDRWETVVKVGGCEGRELKEERKKKTNEKEIGIIYDESGNL
jgi:hypothetical protein